MTDRFRWGVLALCGWAAVVLASFYAVQKPVTAQDVSVLAGQFTAPVLAPTLVNATPSLIALLTAAAMAVAAALWGTRVSPLPYPESSANNFATAEYWLLNMGLGLGVLGAGALLIGVSGLMPMLALLLPAALVIAPGSTARLLRDTLRLSRLRLPRVLLIFAAISLFLALLAALAPPTAWDALVYHLTVPRRALEAGRLSPTGDIIPHENFPILMPALYLLSMAVGGDVAAQLLHFILGLMVLGLVVLTAHRMYSPASVPYALAIVFSMPMLVLLSTWAYSDVALAFYTLAAVYCYQRGTGTDSSGYLVISAAMAGLAMGLKYTSFVLPLGLGLLIACEKRQEKRKRLIRFSLVGLLIAAPWYLKNMALAGNPIYPFVFGGSHWDAVRTQWYARTGSGIGLDLLSLITLPLVATLGIRDANYVDGRVGPLILILLPLLALNRRKMDPFVTMFLLHAGFWTVGVIMSISLLQTRLLLPALVLLAPPLGHAVASLSRFDRQALSLRRIMVFVAAIVLGLNLVTQTVEFLKSDPLPYLLGSETRDQYLIRRLGTHAAVMRAINQLPLGARVQFMWEPRSYLAERSVRADPLLDALPHLIRTAGSLEAGISQLKADGFTHVLVFDSGARFAFENIRDLFGNVDEENLARLEGEYARPVYVNGSYRLMVLK